MSNTGNKVSKGQESVSFTVGRVQPTLYKCHLLSEAAVKMPFWCHADWHQFVYVVDVTDTYCYQEV